MSWKTVKFSEVVQFPPKVNLEKGNLYSFIPMEKLMPGQKYVGEQFLKEWKGSGGAKFEEGDTLFARITPCLQNGKISQAKGLSSVLGFGSTEYFIFRGIEGITDTDFVFYLTLNSDFKEYAIGSMVGASGRQRADAKYVGQYEFVLPPLQTQKRIADILSAYDDLIENNLKRIKLLEQAAQNIYKEWFVNLRFPNHENTPINEETRLPEGWEKKSAFDLFDIKGGTQPPKSQWSDLNKEGYVRMVQIRDYKTDTHIAYVKNTSKLRRCEKEDIMIARYGASVGRICWGIEGVYNVALAKAIPFDNAYLEYIRWYVKSYFFQESLLGMTQRAAQDGFNKDTFKSLEAVIPTMDIVNNFHNIAYPMLKQMELLKNQNQKLKAARDILLPRLMNRTIEV